jgi:hypothetical protein
MYRHVLIDIEICVSLHPQHQEAGLILGLLEEYYLHFRPSTSAEYLT